MSRARELIENELTRRRKGRAENLLRWHHGRRTATKYLNQVYANDEAIRELEAALERISDE